MKKTGFLFELKVDFYFFLFQMTIGDDFAA